MISENALLQVFFTEEQESLTLLTLGKPLLLQVVEMFFFIFLFATSLKPKYLPKTVQPISIPRAIRLCTLGSYLAPFSSFARKVGGVKLNRKS